MKIIGGFMDTRSNDEDFAITPYIFGVLTSSKEIIGLGICWGFWSLHIAIGFGLPKNFPSFRIWKYDSKTS